VGATGLEPVTPSVSSKGPSDASETGKGLVTAAPARCTSGCTSTSETANAATVEALAVALLGLSAADRGRLVALLLGQDAKGGTAHNAP
jgi:hypothetical protein